MNVFIYIYLSDIWQILTTVTVKKLCEINNKALTIHHITTQFVNVFLLYKSKIKYSLSFRTKILTNNGL